jgi:5-methyltetrahydrofolate--homocysteine methyltransferase
MTIDVRFGPQDWDRIRRDYDAWWRHELDRPLVYLTGSTWRSERPWYAVHSFVSNYPLDMPAEEVIALLTPHVEATDYYGDAFPRWWVNTGPGILAGFLGARVHSTPETVWFDPARPVAARDLQLAIAPDNPWLARVTALTEAAVTRWGHQVQVGHTDLGGNLDVLASLRTTQGLLYDLYDAPQEIERLVRQVTACWLVQYEALYALIRRQGLGTTPWAPIWSAGRCYMLQCDLSYMLSPAMFERFVLPDLASCCEHLDHGFYHLDGPGQIPHLDLLLSLPRLRGIQWIPGAGNPEPEGWLPLLKRIMDGGKLCQVFVTAQGALDIVSTIGGRGMLLAIAEQMVSEQADAFLRQLAREDVSRR